MTTQKATSQADEQVSRLAGPQALALSATHPLGPLARWSGRVLHVPALPFTLVNTGSAPLTPVTLTLDPLEREQDGASVDARLCISHNGAALSEDIGVVVIELGPYEVVRLQVAAEGQLPPGRSVSRLRIRFADTDKPLVIPVTVRVAAHWLWAVGLMLLGLVFLGLTGFLAGVADVRTQQAEVLALRQSIHEFLDRSPPAEADQAVVNTIEEKLAEALETLSTPRPLEIRDWRLPLAERNLEQVQKQFQEFRAQAERKAVGEAEVEDLGKEWEGLLARAQAVRNQLKTQEPAPNQEEAWPALLYAFVRAQRQALLDLPLQAVEGELGPHVERVRLALASGEGARAQALAIKVRRWLRRAARLLDDRVRLLLSWHFFAEEMLVRQAALTDNLRNPALPEEVRRELDGQLTAARGVLKKDFSLTNFKESYSGLQHAETLALAAWSQVIIHAAKTAMRGAAAETSLAEIEAALSHLSPDDPPEVKRENTLAIMDLWGKRVEACRDEAVKKPMLESIETISRRIRNGDLAATGPGFKELLERWGAYEKAQVDKARQTVLKPFCARLASGLREQLRSSGEVLTLLEPHPLVAGLDEELDRVLLGLGRVSEGECLEELTTLHKRLLDAGGQMMTTLILVQDISPEARLAAAEHSEIRAAIDLARRLMTEPRPLRLGLRSRTDGLSVGRQVTLEVPR